MKKVLISMWSYMLFFCLTAFIVTCCMLLFLYVLSQNMDITYTSENISVAAKLTFCNVLFLSGVFTLIDAVRRRYTVDRPVRQITEAAEMITKGDFSVRIPELKEPLEKDTFNRIIVCFNKMARELSGIETLREDFVSNVSHELKTPLAVIRNYVTLLSDNSIDDDKRAEYTKAAIDATEKLNALVSDILKLNKLENQQIFPKTQEYDLGDQLCECLLCFESVWEEKNIDIFTDISDGIRIENDREMMSVVWNNLFSNALKFTERGGKVSVYLKQDENDAVVIVCDNGCGMSGEVGEKIFDKFYQGDISHASDGNGLGLALVKRIMDITGGEISVQSEMGVGSTFTVRLKSKMYEENI